ncbi:MAG: Fic family protein [Bacillota bacterium]|uniref:Fic family protein n=1 Tax=Virgibacillus salarius TaxID=447199 RepID=A0A941E3N4_9BACI|nr:MULTISPECIES: Fic family protein [Virgibacillus]MBR7798233.1 Fic family protein [Virgibacillus salarius]MCC2252684.1 Fic family protein [Virgibacillus sp. AGTR]NAZ10941.1 Fic family protein [Agaribacter marinus]WBX80638.1 Fic family protein [Virgibacillus salarius]
MRYLYKMFHDLNSSDFDDIHKNRISFESTKRLDLSIKPIDQKNVFDLYYVPTIDMLKKCSAIHKTAGNLRFIFEKLPAVAKDQFIRECVVEELYNTNQLEGVRSTKEEIARSVRDAKSNTKDKKRFSSMVNSYLNLLYGDTDTPLYPKDVRSIYNNIIEGEISKNELPDGEIFRKDINYVLSRTGSGKEIHRGLIPEDKIIREMDKLLDFMNDDKETPLLIRTAIGHYFFGYIHPFYDGNGRTSRFISSLYLAKTLGKISALSLSRGCNKYKNKYLKAFEICNSIKNRGEMNFFIDEYLSIILNALKDMLSELKEKVELITSAVEKLKTDDRMESKNHFQFMFVLIQNYYFHYSDGVTVQELSRVMEISEATVRKVAKELLNKSLINQKGTRPAHFRIGADYLEN